MQDVEAIKTAMKVAGLTEKFEKYAAKLNMSVEDCIRSEAESSENEDLLGRIESGDLENMLGEEVA